ncbi:MAG: hypothetical protein F6K24_02130 [Okeania sp. SIO2D1]|nr:hypothetical protein [Okeania sp. SIO2D1]
MNILIYDAETIKAIPGREPRVPGIEYCRGREDFENMGISVIGCHSSIYGDFTYVDNFEEFELIAGDHDEIIGFNSSRLDDLLLRANGINITTTYDLLVEAWAADGLPSVYTPGDTVPGYSLDNLTSLALGEQKTGSGTSAPVLWQQGKEQEAIGYCLNNVRLTKKLYERRKEFISPVSGERLALR